MMSAFFHFQHTLSRLFNNCSELIKVILILDKFYFKMERVERGVKLTIPLPPPPPLGKATLKKLSIIRVKKPHIVIE